MENEIIVSVCMLAYNHEKYAAQSLEGVLMQKTDFKYEILIHDDASTDKTAEIIRSYERKYPDIIKPIYQTENQYSKGVAVGFTFLYKNAKGKYIATCECDDYWTDPYKLQKQVDFLEANKDYVAVGHNVKYVDENGNDYKGEVNDTWCNMPDYEFTLKDANNYYMFGQAASRVYKNIWNTLDEGFLSFYQNLKSVNGDQKISLLLTLLGRVYHMSDIMSCYRLCLTNESWSSYANKKNLNKRSIDGLYQLIEMANYFGVELNYNNQFKIIFWNSLRCWVHNKDKLDFEIFKYVYKKQPHKAAAVLFMINMLFKSMIRKLKNKFFGKK